MTWDATRIAAHITGMLGERSSTVTYGSESVTCRIGQMALGQKMAQAGAFPSYRFSVYTVYSDWTTLPTEGEKVTIDGTTYRVIQTQDYGNGIALRLDCGAEEELRGATSGGRDARLW